MKINKFFYLFVFLVMPSLIKCVSTELWLRNESGKPITFSLDKKKGELLTNNSTVKLLEDLFKTIYDNPAYDIQIRGMDAYTSLLKYIIFAYGKRDLTRDDSLVIIIKPTDPRKPLAWNLSYGFSPK